MKKTAKIMVADKEKKTFLYIKGCLPKNKYSITHVNSAEKALKKMEKESFLLVIFDLVMPAMNGLEFLKHVKKRWGNVKVIIMTAYASTDTAVKAIRLGASDYISKPFTPEELKNSVDMSLEGKFMEADIPEQERENINTSDLNINFDRDVKSTMIGKTGSPQKKTGIKNKNFLGIDKPINYEKVISITGPEYIQNSQHETAAFLQCDNPDDPFTLREKSMHAYKNKKSRSGKKTDQNILIIDDDVTFNKNISQILSSKGYVVEQVFTKTEAIEMVDNTAYELILLDLKIHGVKGFELLKFILNKRPEAKVIIVTGYASIETAVESARIGAFDYLSKPLTTEEICRATHMIFYGKAYKSREI